MIKFKKNRFKVIRFYIVAFFAINIVLWAILELFVKDESVTMFFVFGEIVLFSSVIMNKNALLGELNQTVILNDNKIECKSFFVSGDLADATFEYDQIKSIQMKRTLFSRHLIIKVKGSEAAPVVLNNQFKDYLKLWVIIGDSCMKLNPEIYIDSKTYDYLQSIKKTGDGSLS